MKTLALCFSLVACGAEPAQTPASNDSAITQRTPNPRIDYTQVASQRRSGIWFNQLYPRIAVARDADVIAVSTSEFVGVFDAHTFLMADDAQYAALNTFGQTLLAHDGSRVWSWNE